MNQSFLSHLVVWYAVFLFSTSLHEAAHAWFAARGGDYLAYNAGQVSLNPIPHIRRERMGMVLVPLLSFFFNYTYYRFPWMFGWASTPFDPERAARRPGHALLMSLAGPLSHILPFLVAWIAMFLGLRFGFFIPGFVADNSVQIVVASQAGGFIDALALFFDVLFKLNLSLMVFNLLPFPPMDGSEVWFLLLRDAPSRLRFRHYFQSYGLAGLVLAWYVFPTVFSPVYNQARLSLFRLGLGI
ncbi:MAG: site-2 protease family protein, partial [Planctomycetota bacterium]|nr:site-2 protease family protein [Planctomycetota bacterium]